MVTNAAHQDKVLIVFYPLVLDQVMEQSVTLVALVALPKYRVV